MLWRQEPLTHSLTLLLTRSPWFLRPSRDCDPFYSVNVTLPPFSPLFLLSPYISSFFFLPSSHSLSYYKGKYECPVLLPFQSNIFFPSHSLVNIVLPRSLADRKAKPRGGYPSLEHVLNLPCGVVVCML